MQMFPPLCFGIFVKKIKPPCLQSHLNKNITCLQPVDAHSQLTDAFPLFYNVLGFFFNQRLFPWMSRRKCFPNHVLWLAGLDLIRQWGGEGQKAMICHTGAQFWIKRCFVMSVGLISRPQSNYPPFSAHTSPITSPSFPFSLSCTHTGTYPASSDPSLTE